MLRVLRHSLVFAVITFAIHQYVSHLGASHRPYPTRPIQVVVPYSPCGTTDTLARILQKGIKDNQLIPVPFVVVNKPGGATTIGSTYVRNARPDGYTVLCLHEAIMTAKVAGQSPYGPEVFEPVAATGEEGHFVLAADDGRFPSMQALMTAARETPHSVKFGVNLAMPSHFSGLALERSMPDARFRFVSTGGGANRLAALMGGHLDAALFSTSEYIRFRENGLRALAYLGPNRHAAAPEVPTGIELGLSLNDTNLQYWWFPKGTDPERVEYLADVLESAMATEFVRNRLNELHIAPRVIRGNALSERIDRRTAHFSAMTLPGPANLPNVAGWVLAAVLLFGIATLIDTIRLKRKTAETIDPSRRSFTLTVAVVVVVLLYALSMGMGALSFVWATALFVLACGLLLFRGNRGKIIYVVELALIMSFGLHYVLTRIFSITLPG